MMKKTDDSRPTMFAGARSVGQVSPGGLLKFLPLKANVESGGTMPTPASSWFLAFSFGQRKRNNCPVPSARWTERNP